MSADCCTGARKYRGIYYPRCNGGVPCNSCLAKWRENHYQYPNEILRPPHPRRRRFSSVIDLVEYVELMTQGFFRIT